MASHASGLGPEMAAEIRTAISGVIGLFLDDASDSTGSHADMTSKLPGTDPEIL